MFEFVVIHDLQALRVARAHLIGKRHVELLLAIVEARRDHLKIIHQREFKIALKTGGDANETPEQARFFNDGQKTYEAAHAFSRNEDRKPPVFPFDDIVKAADVFYIGIQGVDMAPYPFGVAETLQLQGIAGKAVFDEETGREFPVIAVASEAMHHKHRSPRGRAAPLPVKDIPLFAFFHICLLSMDWNGARENGDTHFYPVFY